MNDYITSSHGRFKIHHYGQGRCLRRQATLPLSYNFVTDAAQYQEEILQRPIPTLIMHGKQDEVIPIAASRELARLRPWVELIELESDACGGRSHHGLGNVMAEIWQAIHRFCEFP